MNHELRNPLNSLNGMLETLMVEGVSGNRLIIESCFCQVQFLINIIDQMLEYFSIKSDDAEPPQIMQFNIVDSIQALMKFLSFKAKMESTKLEISFFPEALKSVLVTQRESRV